MKRDIEDEIIKDGEWILDDDDANTWQCPDCDLLWQLTTGRPLENNMNYCPQCGKKMNNTKEARP